MKIKLLQPVGAAGEWETRQIAEQKAILDRLGVSGAMVQTEKELYSMPRPVYNSKEEFLLEKMADAWFALRELGERSEAKSVTAEDFAEMMDSLKAAKTEEEAEATLNHYGYGPLGVATKEYVAYKKSCGSKRRERAV